MQPTGHEHRIPVLTLPVRQVMRRDFVTVPPNESLADAYQLMRFARLRHLLVEEHGYLVGILSYRDLQDILVSPATHRPAKASSDDPVTRAMRAKPYAITPDTRLCDAATRLCSLRLGCLPVVERTDVRPALVGIVTEVDLLLAAYQSSGSQSQSSGSQSGGALANAIHPLRRWSPWRSSCWRVWHEASPTRRPWRGSACPTRPTTQPRSSPPLATWTSPE